MLTGQERFVPSHFTEERQVRRRTDFSTQQQLVLYREFLANQNLDARKIKSLAEQLGVREKDIKWWWYNRRSDVRDGTFQLPRSVMPYFGCAKAGGGDGPGAGQ